MSSQSIFNDKNTENDFKLFFSDKESIYDERRKRIKTYCKLQPNNFSRSYRILFWNQDAGISMCLINKIASTTYRGKPYKDPKYLVAMCKKFLKLDWGQ